MKKIVVLVITAFVIAIAGLGYTGYMEKKLEAEAYKYCANNTYTLADGLEVTDIVKVNDNEYNIHYTYIDHDGKNHTATQNGVTL